MTRNELVNAAADAYVHRWDRAPGQSLDAHLDEALDDCRVASDEELKRRIADWGADR